MMEANGRRRVNVQLSAQLSDCVDELAQKLGVSRSDVFRLAVAGELEGLCSGVQPYAEDSGAA